MSITLMRDGASSASIARAMDYRVAPAGRPDLVVRVIATEGNQKPNFREEPCAGETFEDFLLCRTR